MTTCPTCGTDSTLPNECGCDLNNIPTAIPNEFDKKMIARGYHYKIDCRSGRFESLYSKTAAAIESVKRDYPAELWLVSHIG